MHTLISLRSPSPPVLAAVVLAATLATAQDASDPDSAHEAAFVGERYPSATACGECHPVHYRQWSVSQHAYAQMSPVFNAMAGKILKLTNGTNGDFCIRCHSPVGMNLEEPEFMSNIDRHPTSREGITCVTCHRVNRAYGKLSGRLAIAQGEVTEPVYGPSGDPTELAAAIEQGGLITDPARAGRKVHETVEPFFQLPRPGFCGTCHDVTLANGFRLEEAFSEFKNSPAAKRGLTCNDCHMGKEPGRALADPDDPDFEAINYARGPAAQVGSRATAERKLTNHLFVGPDYSVLPPSLFPMNIRAIKEESEKDDPAARGFATIREWLEFDWKAGWGTDDFEDSIADDHVFPERWDAIDDRYDAREIVEENLELLDMIEEQRLKLLRNGYLIGETKVDRADDRSLRFRVEVRSGTDGHNVPTGFDAERLVWLNVEVRDVRGTVIHRSGDLDPNGDLRDLHSAYVHNRELPIDGQLFSLQSRFVTQNLRGGEREQVLAVNYSLGPLPFIRPAPGSTVLTGRPLGARKHKMGIEPGGRRWAKYEVERAQLTGYGPYTARIELKAAMVPVSLVNEVRDVGFDYGLSARDVAEGVVAGHQVVWDRELVFDVHGSGGER